MQKPSKPQVVVLLVIMALVFFGGMQYGKHQQNRIQAAATLLNVIEDTSMPLGAPPALQPESQPATPPQPLAVHVKGAVARPGLYELPAGSRVDDALNMAGLLPDANTDIINLALTLSDGIEVVVPFRLEGEETDWQAIANNAALPPANTAAASNANSATASSAININTANLTALQSLSGIGPAKAQAIIDYREQHGPFAKIEDIKKVSGIGPSTYDTIKDHISVE